MRVEEVRKEAERLKLKEKAADLAEAANLKKNKRKKVVEVWSDLELNFDRPYVSGHDSLSEEEDVHVILFSV